MADRLILCSECGTRNRIGVDRAARPTCGNCGKVLSVPGYSGTGLGQFFKPVKWFAFGVLSVIGIFYYNDPNFIRTTRVLDFLYTNQSIPQKTLSDDEAWGTQPTNKSPPNTPVKGIRGQIKGVSDFDDLVSPSLLPSPEVNPFDQFDDLVSPSLLPVKVSTGILQQPLKRGVAPLLIRTNPGFDYYVKLAKPGTGREVPPVMALYIRGGESFETLVPLGTYEIRYAAGHMWFGEDVLFGKDRPSGTNVTHFSKADKLFKFDFDGESYSGFTVELIMQLNGNLPVSTISAQEF